MAHCQQRKEHVFHSTAQIFLLVSLGIFLEKHGYFVGRGKGRGEGKRIRLRNEILPSHIYWKKELLICRKTCAQSACDILNFNPPNALKEVCEEGKFFDVGWKKGNGQGSAYWISVWLIAPEIHQTISFFAKVLNCFRNRWNPRENKPRTRALPTLIYMIEFYNVISEREGGL